LRYIASFYNSNNTYKVFCLCILLIKGHKIVVPVALPDIYSFPRLS